jgi:hypothetical protein
MEFVDESWDDPEDDLGYGSAEDAGVGPGELYRRLVSDEEGRRYWSESAWSHEAVGDRDEVAALFATRQAEAELLQEMRLSELWERCQGGTLTMDEFFELSALITEVNGITGSLCVDCAMLDRPNVSANWALATTTLCRGHLRFRLGYARIDGGGAPRPA